MFSLLQNVAGICCKLLALRVLGADAVRDLFARLCEYRYFAGFFKVDGCTILPCSVLKQLLLHPSCSFLSRWAQQYGFCGVLWHGSAPIDFANPSSVQEISEADSSRVVHVIFLSTFWL
jgi:hypothetical protein